MPLSPQPCQSSYCYCQEVLDRLIQCGLLVAEEVGRAAGDKAPAWVWPPSASPGVTAARAPPLACVCVGGVGGGACVQPLA